MGLSPDDYRERIWTDMVQRDRPHNSVRQSR